MLIFSFIDII